MPMILITPLSALPSVIGSHAPSHIVTLLSSGYMIETPQGFPADRHLRLSMHDIADEGMPESPANTHVDELIAFGRGWDASAPMLVHCWAGISRSTAAAFVSVCALSPERDEREIARAIRSASPTATPNIRIVRFADGILGRQGRMVSAIEAIGRGASAEEGVPFRLDLA